MPDINLLTVTDDDLWRVFGEVPDLPGGLSKMRVEIDNSDKDLDLFEEFLDIDLDLLG